MVKIDDLVNMTEKKDLIPIIGGIRVGLRLDKRSFYRHVLLEKRLINYKEFISGSVKDLSYAVLMGLLNTYYIIGPYLLYDKLMN